MTDRYPGYDVLSKRDTPSWNAKTREVIEKRLNVPRQPRFFNAAEWQTLGAVCERIVPQPDRADKVPLPAYVDEKMHLRQLDGYRYPGMPEQGEAWRRGLAALDEAAEREDGRRFHTLDDARQDAILRDMEHGRLRADALGDMPANGFFHNRVLHDVVLAYYAMPVAWNEIGFGGPASPRGYVRLQLGRRDPWEPVEAQPGGETKAERVNRRVG